VAGLVLSGLRTGGHHGTRRPRHAPRSCVVDLELAIRMKKPIISVVAVTRASTQTACGRRQEPSSVLVLHPIATRVALHGRRALRTSRHSRFLGDAAGSRYCRSSPRSPRPCLCARRIQTIRASCWIPRRATAARGLLGSACPLKRVERLPEFRLKNLAKFPPKRVQLSLLMLSRDRCTCAQ
jgi:hypothetical protein